MTLLASLTNRIFLASALLAMATIGLAIYLVSARVTREAEAELERGLVESTALVDQQRTALSNQLLLLTRLVADLPKFKAAVETQDPPTVRPIAEDYRAQLDVELLLVTDRHGRLVFGPGDEVPPDAVSAVAEALAGRETAAFWLHRRGILQVVTLPVSVGRDVPDVLGTLSAGFLLDDRRAEQFKHATASDVAFAMGGVVRAATLGADARRDLSGHTPDRGVSRLHLGDEEYVLTSVPLSLPLPAVGSAPAPPVVLVLRSRTLQLRSLRTVNAALLVTAGLSVLLATLASYVVSRSVTRPLGAITAAMREMASTGDLTRKITLRGPAWWQDEDARLLAATFNTLTDSIARFQREAAQRERLSSLGRLSTVIAHEVRNPLMIIKAALRSLGPASTSEEVREAAADIDEQVGRLNRIVHDVLDFARPPRFALAATDIGAVCRAAAAAVTAADPSGPPVAVRAETTRIVSDPDRLHAALVNILANARQAVEAGNGGPSRATGAGGSGAPGTGDAIVLTVTEGAGGRVRIAIRDRGIGVPPEHLAQIFEPYYTTRRTGTGLGLPITRNIIEGLGGTIAVRAESPGTTIEIELPRVAPDPPGGAAAAAS